MVNRYLINIEKDRENAVVAFANAGYKVHVEKETFLLTTNYFVVVEDHYVKTVEEDK